MSVSRAWFESSDVPDKPYTGATIKPGSVARGGTADQSRAMDQAQHDAGSRYYLSGGTISGAEHIKPGAWPSSKDLAAIARSAGISYSYLFGFLNTRGALEPDTAQPPARNGPRLATLQRDLARLDKQYWLGNMAGKRRRICERKMQALKEAIAQHRDTRKGAA